MRFANYLLPVALLISGCAWRDISPYDRGGYELSRKAMEVTGSRDPSSIFYFSERPIGEEPDYAITVGALLEIKKHKVHISRELLDGIDVNHDSVVVEEEAGDFFSNKR